jgi:soluble lytic murein transglycosylase-like protein
MTRTHPTRRPLRKLPLLLAAAGIFGLACAAPVSAQAQEVRLETTPAGNQSVSAAISEWNRGLQDAADSILNDTGDAAPAAAGGIAIETAAASTEPQGASDAVQSFPEGFAEQEPAVGRLALARLAPLQPMIEPVLRSHGLPRALLAVVVVESGGRTEALSPKGALGLWQLMPETARRYGLEVSGERDERLDPVMATRAAARYLHDLYGRFGDWQLALAAYNAGEGAVLDAMQRAQSSSFSALSDLRLLPAETRSYVPAVLRASRAFGHLQPEHAKTEPEAAKGRVSFATVVLNPAITEPEIDHFRVSAEASPGSD